MKKIFLALLALITAQITANVYLKPTPQFNPHVEIAVVYIEHNGKILLLHRQDNKSQGKKWGIPGGKVKKNETTLEAAIREIKEETGYDISNQPIEDLGALYIEYDEKDHFIHHMFRTQLKDDPNAVKINFREHKGFTWVSPIEGLQMDLMQDEDECFLLTYFPN